MAKKYQPKEFEKKWIEEWEKEKVYKTPLRPAGGGATLGVKEYVLVMFPYPSGAGLHVGHVRVYTGTDVLARYFRMNGKSVLHPMGWDAFGLPAENAAIKAKKNPIDLVPEHIVTFKRQMQQVGLSYDWDREVTTTEPEYYKWTQWLFIRFYKMGLLYKKNTLINFCPFCKTGLSDEEILADGTHERCGAKITKKELPQWIFKITKYADRLLKDLDGLDWPRGILEMQRNWIGKKEGINMEYPVKNTDETIICFTTAPVNFGMTFIVVAPEHELIKKIMNKKISVDPKIRKNIIAYYEKAQKKSEIERETEGKEKTGVFTGLYATNRIAGWDVPVWVSDFVIGHVGTGAVQGCPGHDYKDFEFAKKFKLPIIRVVEGKNGDKSPIEQKEQVIVKGMKGKVCNSKFLNGLDFAEGLEKTMDYAEEKGWGRRVVTYHLRDWIFSRQRYWGEPIPMVYCKKDGWVPVPDEELPVKLPYVKSYEPTGTGESPLATISNWVNTKCPKCGKPAKRETDTMPNWAGSCWYFLRFADSKNNQEAWSREAIKKWLPVDWYIGGAEHAVLHLLYSRFWIKALQDLKLLNFSEPFLRLRNVGIVIAQDSRKMSKSFGNVINPDDVIAEFGADTLRVYEMFMAPFNSEIAWSTKALQGAYRFLKRVWDLYNNSEFIIENSAANEDKKLVVKLQKTIRKVTDDIPQMKFNTSIAAMMEFVNVWEGKTLPKEEAKQFLKILAPFAPFMAEEIWREVLQEKGSIHLSAWPKAVGEIVEEEITIPVQVNGKLRGTVKIQNSESKNQNLAIEKALKAEGVKKYVAGKGYKAIYIPGKILNLVTG